MANKRNLFLSGIAGLVLAGSIYAQEPETTNKGRETKVEQEEKKINYKTADFSKDTEEILLARMIFGEARGQSYLERIAVGYTAVNRAKDGKKFNGSNVREAILKPKQYSCFDENNVNRKKLMEPENEDAKSFYECLKISKKILSGVEKDPTNGATHYFNPKLASPPWADKIKKIGRIKIGKGLSVHEFYKEK